MSGRMELFQIRDYYEIKNSAKKQLSSGSIETEEGGVENYLNLISKAFVYKNTNWGGIFITQLPGIDYPDRAVDEAQSIFNYSVLKQAAIQTAEGKHMVCNYTPDGAKYQFYVETPVSYGFSKRA